MGSNDSTAKEQSFLFNVNKIFLVIHAGHNVRRDGASKSFLYDGKA